MKNAYIGYSYQKCVTLFFLVKMDVERELDSIEIEARVNNDFDDLVIHTTNNTFYFQIKDINNVSLENLKIVQDKILIGGKEHALSNFTNVIFFKHVDMKPNNEIFGIPCYKMDDVYIVSLNRESIDEKVGVLYGQNRHRESVINKFLDRCLDKRRFKIERISLPFIPVFDTKLIEPTIDLGRVHLKVENILVIEGKPGIGKSHLVNCLAKEYHNNVIYRFWISSQDKDYDQRLKYCNFIFDISKKCFHDQVQRSEDDVIKQLWKTEKTIIIDGLDHVENYNGSELKYFIEFIKKLQTGCKTIILTRPLQYKLPWSKKELVNWNESQTSQVLDELFHISNYQACSEIYLITGGYPILVKYLAEHYREFKTVPDIGQMDSIDHYYSVLLGSNVKTKSALTIFLCCRSFFTMSEINFFLEGELSTIVKEFIDGYPYLFERRLNRVSLLHDSFNTYLRRQGIDYRERQRTLNEKVTMSILNSEQKFLSRFRFFDLNMQEKKEIVIKYSSILAFKALMKNVVDFESVQSFYAQIRETVVELSPDDLRVEEFYDLSLIFGLVSRDHISTMNRFLYTYVKTLLCHGYDANDITSSGYLFAMLHFIETANADLLLNVTNDDLYDTRHFFEDLKDEIVHEDTFFSRHESVLSKEQIDGMLMEGDENAFCDNVVFILENLFLHGEHQFDFPDLTMCVKEFLHSDSEKSVYFLKRILEDKGFETYRALWILNDVRKEILALGHLREVNDYLNLSLKDFVSKNHGLRSFDLCTELLNYIRLALFNNKSIDILSIASFWTKFYQRKDYTLLGIPNGLKVFEDKGLITRHDSVRLIMAIQNSSEKGYRRLLATYVELQSIDIVEFLIDEFGIDQLNIAWFELPIKYIDCLPDIVFHREMRELLKYHRYDKQIDFDKIENVIQSKRCDDFREILPLTGYVVRTGNVEQSDLLRGKRISVNEYIDDKKITRHDGKQRFMEGILTKENKNLIGQMNLSPEQVASFSDVGYATLSDITLFDFFESQELAERIGPILYNALVGKARTVDSFQYVYFLPGNVPLLLSEYSIPVNFESLFKRFVTYLEMSMFHLTPRDSNNP